MACESCSPLVREICRQEGQCALAGGEIYAPRVGSLSGNPIHGARFVSETVSEPNFIPSGHTTTEQKNIRRANSSTEAPGI